VTESGKSKNDVPLETSIPGGAVSLESILRTEELRRRPWRPPDYEKENRALAALASALANSRPNILQTLAETILDVTECDSSGLSLLTEDGKRFYWPAIAGMWKPHIGGGTPRDFGPCGDVLDRNCTLLFHHFEQRYPYFRPVVPLVEECLLVPFYVGEKAVGTIWAITHSDRHKFDAEDDRLMSTLGQFASLAYQTLASIEDLRSQIAAREKAEAGLRELATGLEAKVRRLVDSNIIGIFIWRLGQIIDANEAFLHIVGYGRDDLVSGRLRWRELTAPEWRNADDRRVAELKATGRAQPYEKEYFQKGGARVPVLVGAASFEEGGDEGVAFVLDLSEQKRAEEGLRRAQADLAHINRVNTMGELTASLAHEIKQPISAAVTDASTCLRWLARDPPDVAEAQEAASRLIKDTARASDIISRIGSLFKKDLLQRELVDLNELVQEMIVLLRSEAARFSISIHGDLVSALPRVEADRIQLQQVFMNLMLNGLEAIKEMGTPGKLTITSEQDENGQLLVSVADTGLGLQPEQADQIFDVFFTTKSQGTGMGLPISRSIIESHGGHLWGTSNSGPGATFHFNLPIEVAAH
jgi:PAS domain S-box-containing protein